MEGRGGFVVNRFLVEGRDFEKKVVVVEETEDVHHLARVLRVRIGETLALSDGEGSRCQAAVSAIEKGRVIFDVVSREPKIHREDQRVRLTLVCAVPKFAHFEEVVDKGTQLGVDEIIPMFTERSLVDRDGFLKKKSRYERLRTAAGKQSGALFLPILSAPVSFSEVMGRARSFDLVLIPNLADAACSLRDVLTGFSGGRLCVLIGPEGDFSPSEIEAAMSMGARGVDLGSSVLRVDTGAIAVMSYVRIVFTP
jgi:16S rRNA (uracil1498-N3)-methyltransferase